MKSKVERDIDKELEEIKKVRLPYGDISSGLESIADILDTLSQNFDSSEHIPSALSGVKKELDVISTEIFNTRTRSSVMSETIRDGLDKVGETLESIREDTTSISYNFDIFVRAYLKVNNLTEEELE